MRISEIKRTTNETNIALTLNLDGCGTSEIATGCGFLDHMLTLFAKHAHYDLKVLCRDDTHADYHHATEDIGIVLGRAFSEAVGDKKGIERYGDTCLPMDEALILTATDIGGRAYLGFSVQIPTEKVGDFDTELCEEFWAAFVREAKISLHIRQLAGANSHHIIEGIFKSAARTLRKATAVNKDFADEIPSTKGVIG